MLLLVGLLLLLTHGVPHLARLGHGIPVGNLLLLLELRNDGVGEEDVGRDGSGWLHSFVFGLGLDALLGLLG